MAKRRRVRHVSPRRVFLKDLVRERRELTAALLRHQKLAHQILRRRDFHPVGVSSCGLLECLIIIMSDDR